MSDKVSTSFKKLDNGNVEIVFTIPANVILLNKEYTLKEFAKDAVIAGFRKGKAPIAKVESTVSEEKLTEHILSHILPKAFSDSVSEYKYNPAIYPKFEAVKITPSKNLDEAGEWQIKAITCELPRVILPKDYKKKLKKDPPKGEAGPNVLVRSLLEAVKIEVPRLLIEEEVNGRLSQVLERIEKLGLTLEGYLKSVGKTPEILRVEYDIQSRDAIALELILNEVANEEKIEVTDAEIDEMIKATGEDVRKVAKDQRDMLKRVILRRKALEKISPK